jgi:hypothetical protein
MLVTILVSVYVNNYKKLKSIYKQLDVKLDEYLEIPVEYLSI